MFWNSSYGTLYLEYQISTMVVQNFMICNKLDCVYRMGNVLQFENVKRFDFYDKVSMN